MRQRIGLSLGDELHESVKVNLTGVYTCLQIV